MAGSRARLQVGSAPWVAEERSSAHQIAGDEIDEFSFSARNDFEWLNEHMADIFSENQINVADIFKTPGKLRGKTPRTVRKANLGEARVPLSDIFSATPKGTPKPLAIGNIDRSHTPKVKVAADPQPAQALPSSVRTVRQTSPLKRANPPPLVDSGYHGSQPQDVMDIDNEDAEARPEDATQPFNQDNTKHDHIAIHSSPKRAASQSPVHQDSPAPTIDTVGDELEAQCFTAQIVKLTSPPIKMIQPESTTPMGSPSRSAAQEPPKTASPVEMSPEKEATPVVEPTAPRPDDQPEPQSDAPSDAQLDDQPEPQSDAPSDAQFDTQSEPHSEAQSDAQSDVESEDSDAQSDAEPEAEAEAEPEILREAQSEPHSEPEPPAQQEVQPESQPEAEQEPQPEALPVALAQPQSEPGPISSHEKLPEAEAATDIDAMDTALDEKEGSPSDGSSPIRPVVRKSSLNFASLPAREPMTHKSTGHRVSRLSHLDQNRTSYYNRHTGGKSLGHARPEESDDDNDDMDLDDDDEDEIDTVAPQNVAESEEAIAHTKTYTQRLQDQISKLGQTQPPSSRPSKSITTAVPMPQPSFATTTPAPQRSSREKMPMTQATPGAFPEDDDDDWILPLGTPDNASNTPRPGMLKSYSAEVVEGIAGKATVSGSDFAALEPQQPESARKSPHRSEVPLRVAGQLGHHKSMSVPSLPQLNQQEQTDSDGGDVQKTASALNPPMNMVSENTVDVQTSPAKSPTRGVFRESPLKHVKGKLSSILKSSRGLLASAELQMSPSANRFGAQPGPSTASVDRIEDKGSNPLYPDLSKQLADVDAPPSPTRNVPGSPTRTVPGSPTRPEGRRTRASIEREKAEERKKKEQAKEARRMAKQEEELKKAREKERERARVFSQEQERIADLEKQVAAQKEQERKAAATAPTPRQPAKLTRASPRKAEARVGAEAQADEDTDMVDVPAAKPPPSAHRTAVLPPPSVSKPSQIKRPIRPTKESASKPRQAPPTVIKVNMAPKQGQQTPFQPNSSVASSIADPFRSSRMEPPSLQKKASQASLKDKSTAIRPPALVRAERMKEKEEKNAQAKREAKAEIARKRAAAQEEERRREQQQKLEAEKQKEEERKQAAAQAQAKKTAQRQAMLEKAKQTRAPPPAPRAVNGQPDYKGLQGEPSAIRPPSRLQSTAHRSQEELGRPVNSLMSSTMKPSAKRTMQQEPKETKRMRMSDDMDDDVELENKPSIKGAPVRPSGGFKKVTAATMLPQGQKPSKPQDMAAKSLFPSGYTPAGQGVNRDLFKSTLTSQHPPGKTAHPLDMAQVSKSTIPFASNPAGPSLKTPARPAGLAGAKSVAKSATRSSPRFQNGEAIVLPEINTDDEDESDDDDQKNMFPSWTDSPALREALFDQETMDPTAVFGAPGPLNMEEVFSKSKDRWAKFRARTSSANWSGADRLTEDDIRKDLAARDKLRRDGAWSYEMSKDVL